MSQSLGKWRFGDGCTRSPILIPPIFFLFFSFLETWFRRVDSFVSHALAFKRCPVSGHAGKRKLRHTQNPHARSHVEAAWGDVFPPLCMVWGDESTKYKVGLQGFTGRTFFSRSFVNLCLKGLHIKLVGLSPVLLISLLPASWLYWPRSSVCSRSTRRAKTCCGSRSTRRRFGSLGAFRGRRKEKTTRKSSCLCKCSLWAGSDWWV